ncbi:MAG: hypothetical protein QGF00_22520 [Planctomycetota bacterium]|nr:hypothetical protein [Planctomycetota bacterium]MDP7252402.1 hypothetical protein [Planctomycetota bacterium]
MKSHSFASAGRPSNRVEEKYTHTAQTFTNKSLLGYNIMLTALGMAMRAKGERPQCVDLVVSKPISLRRLRRVLALFCRG